MFIGCRIAVSCLYVVDVSGVTGQWQKSMWGCGLLPVQTDGSASCQSSLLQWSWDCQP